MSTARPFSSSKLKTCILRSRFPSPINHVKPWICDKKRYIWVLGTFLCHRYMQLNFLEPNLQLNQTTCTETGATELGNSVPPGSAWTLDQAPDNAAMEHLSHWFESVLGPYRSQSTKGIQEIVPRKVGRAKPRHGVPPDMVKELLQPLNGGETDPTELGNRNLAPILESHGWVLKSPWNRPFYPPLYCAGSWGWKGWWMGNCRVSHGSYPFTADRNRCHRFWKTGATGFHLTRGLLSTNSSLHFLFHFSFIFIFAQPSVSDMDLRDFDEMWEIQSLQSLEIRMSSFLWTLENLVIYG
jgi:hypothetical protein